MTENEWFDAVEEAEKANAIENALDAKRIDRYVELSRTGKSEEEIEGIMKAEGLSFPAPSPRRKRNW